MVMVVSMSVKPRRLYPIRIEQVLVPMLLGRFQSPFFGSNRREGGNNALSAEPGLAG